MPRMPHICGFLDCFSFSHFLPLLSLLELKTKFNKFCTNFWKKKVKFLASRCICLLLRSKPVQRNCLHFFKNQKETVRALRVNETKATLRNAFIDILFALESEIESKNDKRTLFRDCPRILHLSINP